MFWWSILPHPFLYREHAACSSETSAPTYQSTQHNPEEHHMNVFVAVRLYSRVYVPGRRNSYSPPRVLSLKLLEIKKKSYLLPSRKPTSVKRCEIQSETCCLSSKSYACFYSRSLNFKVANVTVVSQPDFLFVFLLPKSGACLLHLNRPDHMRDWTASSRRHCPQKRGQTCHTVPSQLTFSQLGLI
jgi:hypothetical protein